MSLELHKAGAAVSRCGSAGFSARHTLRQTITLNDLFQVDSFYFYALSLSLSHLSIMWYVTTKLTRPDDTHSWIVCSARLQLRVFLCDQFYFDSDCGDPEC